MPRRQCARQLARRDLHARRAARFPRSAVARPLLAATLEKFGPSTGSGGHANEKSILENRRRGSRARKEGSRAPTRGSREQPAEVSRAEFRLSRTKSGLSRAARRISRCASSPPRELETSGPVDRSHFSGAATRNLVQATEISFCGAWIPFFRPGNPIPGPREQLRGRPGGTGCPSRGRRGQRGAAATASARSRVITAITWLIRPSCIAAITSSARITTASVLSCSSPSGSATRRAPRAR